MAAFRDLSGTSPALTARAAGPDQASSVRSAARGAATRLQCAFAPRTRRRTRRRNDARRRSRRPASRRSIRPARPRPTRSCARSSRRAPRPADTSRRSPRRRRDTSGRSSGASADPRPELAHEPPCAATSAASSRKDLTRELDLPQLHPDPVRQLLGVRGVDAAAAQPDRALGAAPTRPGCPSCRQRPRQPGEGRAPVGEDLVRAHRRAGQLKPASSISLRADGLLARSPTPSLRFTPSVRSNWTSA